MLNSDNTVALLTRLELGGRGIDTALMYGDVAQKEVGAAVKWGISRGISRKELFVATKIPCCPQTKNDTFSSWCTQNPGTWDASANIEHDFEMLGVEYVDLMLLHWPCTLCLCACKGRHHWHACSLP